MVKVYELWENEGAISNTYKFGDDKYLPCISKADFDRAISLLKEFKKDYAYECDPELHDRTEEFLEECK